MDTSNIPRNIRAILRESGIKQANVVLIADIHPTHLSRIVNGMQKPNVDTLVKIAKALNVKVNDLLVTRA